MKQLEEIISVDDVESSNSSEDQPRNSPVILELESVYDDEEPTNSGLVQASKVPSNTVHASVRRSNISTTTVQEGNEELEDLDVEAYDQQTYERGVFDQVDEVMLAARTDVSRGDSDTSTRRSNFMNLIHCQNEPDQGEENDGEYDSTARDEEVLQLARLQRLNKDAEPEKSDCDSKTSPYKSLPKIPKISRLATVKIEPIEANTISNQPSQHHDLVTDYRASRTRIDYGESSSSDNESITSEYKPASNESTNDDAEDEEEFDEDIEYEQSDDDHDSEDGQAEEGSRKHKRLQDDGDFKAYQARIKAFSKARAKMRLENILEDGTEFKKLDELVQVDSNLQIPKDVWDNLFEHQKTGVRWFWELHQLGTGGILGDEMGLGKTIQMIAFLTALKNSSLGNAHKGYDSLGPVVLVCPATVMHQWLLEFRKWWPPFRVAILHSTGTFSGQRKNLVQVINKSCGVLIVSYPGVVIYQDYLHNFDWHYAILDEGHKIKNPDAQVTLACKRFRTPHRLILSGSPVQNNLKELWSIFDFIYPGKLGTLPVFMEQFAIPITQGGYANASDIQVQIAYKCTCVLRDTIKPFLLRRTKAEVNNKLKLPDRSEQVLFCKLTDQQRKLYQAYLDSPTVRDIKMGICQVFVGLTHLRKICNHPDLFDSTECKDQIKTAQQVKKTQTTGFLSSAETYGHYKKSGKMMVVEALLKLWKQQNHKVLLFTQSRQMLKIFEDYLNERNYKHLKMDGSTQIGARQTMIEEFNTNDDIFIFLLTTRVGGVGVNLIGANRIIIYDPDWNPSTDIQARERAWRIGQQRHVIIYRLLTAGTIEEKIYHRQVFKLYLTTRVLKDAKQKRFFKTNDLQELFTLGDNEKNIETKALFDDDLQINLNSIKKSKSDRKASKKLKKERKKNRESIGHNQDDIGQALSEEKLQAMREQAKRLSQMIANQYGNKSASNTKDQFQATNETMTETQTGNSICLNGKTIKKEPGLSESNVSLAYKPPQSENKSINDEPERKRKKRPESSSAKKQTVEYLVKQDVYKPAMDTESDRPDPRYKRDDYILERLFKNSSIFGALKHDKIESDSTSDFKIVESEADKVARDAIRALRESRRMCLDSSFGVPTWTGRNGQVASTPRLTPKNRSRAPLMNRLGLGKTTSSEAGPSSGNNESLLESIKRRNQSNPVSLFQNSNDGPDSDEDERDKDFVGKSNGTGAEDMADKIRDFVIFKSARSGEAQTDELLEFFKANFKPDKTPIFKAILYKMCEFRRRGDKGFWLIKSEFRDL